MPNSNQHQLSEGLEASDLARLVDTKVSIDEYKSKIGSDEEIVVISFTVQGRDPAQDLVSFLEKSYDWVIDADASSGEMTEGEYLVFVEVDREPSVAANLVTMFEDLGRLTDIDIEEWDVVYSKPKRSGKADLESLKSIIPLTPEQYRQSHRQMRNDIDSLKTAAGVPVQTTAPVNDYTESLRRAAGLR